MSNVVTAVSLLVDVTAAAAQFTAKAQQISALIQKAQAEGRTTFTAAEWDAVQAMDDAARAALDVAINKLSGQVAT